jgi:hypothetical protein
MAQGELEAILAAYQGKAADAQLTTT